MVFDVIVIAFLKFNFKRKRPKQATIKLAKGHDVSVDKYSFPSGHASRAIMLAPLLSNLFQLELSSLISISMYLITFLVCVSRFLLARHFFSDVIVGMTIGVINYMIIFYFLL